MHTYFYHNAKNISVDFLKKKYLIHYCWDTIYHVVYKMGLKLLWIANSNDPKKKYMVICIYPSPWYPIKSLNSGHGPGVNSRIKHQGIINIITLHALFSNDCEGTEKYQVNTSLLCGQISPAIGPEPLFKGPSISQFR